MRAGGRELLSGLDFLLHPGELCGLIGPSGAGKSTFIKVLLGLRRPASGEVDLGGDTPVGYVPQDDALHTSLTVRQALDFSAMLRLPALDAAARAARIEAVCREVELHERLDLRIHRLSGGQRKRVSVALELLTEPPVLVLDEPTSGLDPGLEARLMDLFRKVARRGRAVLVATHAMQSLDRCDALLVLMAGRVVYFGPPADAPAWFKAQDLADIFRRLPQRSPEGWANAWLAAPQRARFTTRPAPPRSAP